MKVIELLSGEYPHDFGLEIVKDCCISGPWSLNAQAVVKVKVHFANCKEIEYTIYLDMEGIERKEK